MGPLAFTNENIEKCFTVTDVHPMDENIFGDDGFSPHLSLTEKQ
jgi:hypothetical protein